MAAASFLGTGWIFPPAFDNQAGEVMMISDEADVHNSLEVLLSTRPGERVLLPDYGCNLDELVFEPLTTTFVNYMRDLIRTAILYYEPRVTVNGIGISQDPSTDGLILVEVDYTIKATNSRFNYVFPFYKTEANTPSA
jgi:phage baseplate assembly protein W